MLWCSSLTFVLSFFVVSECGPVYLAHHDSIKIVQPNFTDVANHSFTVAITIGMDLLGGGVLVSQRFVLSTASVFQGFNISDLRVRLGSNSAYQGGRHHRIRNVTEHPLYSSNNTEYNLALVQLDRNVSYQIARHISFLARVPFGADFSLANITGYGQDTYGQFKLTDEVGLEFTKVTLYSRHLCAATWRNISVPSTQFCGYSKSSPPCFGDIGDPVTKCVSDRRCELLGIYTGTNLCGVDPNKPQTHLDMSQFRDWIKSVIRQNRTEFGIEDPLWDEIE